MTTLHVIVRGGVQGVGFRWFVREEARSLGVAGWVRNHEDGSVEVLASGDDRQIDLLHQAVRRGPDGARVDSVEGRIPADHADALPWPFAIKR